MRIQRRDAEKMPRWLRGGMEARRKQSPSFARMHKAEPYATTLPYSTCMEMENSILALAEPQVSRDFVQPDIINDVGVAGEGEAWGWPFARSF